MHAAGASDWSTAVINYPVTSGAALYTQSDGQVDVEFGTTRATLASNTEFDVATLDDRALAASEPQGALFLDIRVARSGESYSIDTPRGAVRIDTPGQYEILAGDQSTPTRVAVIQGDAELRSEALDLRAQAGQMIVASGSQPVAGEVQPMPSPDPFLSAMLARDHGGGDVPALVAPMTGGADLSAYGSWQSSEDYGQVWYPNVSPDWVPYREGHWSYVEPWGWTWIDDEPWGFAPFHYGRWAQIGPRWAWVPSGAEDDEAGGPPPEPVYAPALVDFLVAGAAVGAAGALLASGRGDVGWVPLGPREFYRPPYGGSRRYLDRLNRGRGWRQPVWQDARAGAARGSDFHNRHALTVVPAAAIEHAQPINRLSRQPSAAFAGGAAQPLRGPLPFHPAAARPGTAAGLRPAHGPPIRPALSRPGGLAARPVAVPPARGPAPVARPGGLERPGISRPVVPAPHPPQRPETRPAVGPTHYPVPRPVAPALPHAAPRYAAPMRAMPPPLATSRPAPGFAPHPAFAPHPGFAPHPVARPAPPPPARGVPR